MLLQGEDWEDGERERPPPFTQPFPQGSCRASGGLSFIRMGKGLAS